MRFTYIDKNGNSVTVAINAGQAACENLLLLLNKYVPDSEFISRPVPA